MSHDASRRSFLRNGAKVALGSLTGGLLLPWSGGQALALGDVGSATAIVSAMPISADAFGCDI